MTTLNVLNAEASRRSNTAGSPPQVPLSRFETCTLPGLVEYFLSAEAACGSENSAQWEGGQLAPAVGRAWGELRSVWGSRDFVPATGKARVVKTLEFFRLHRGDMVTPDSMSNLALHEFEERLVGAGQQAGIPTKLANALASVAHDLVENVFQHSDGNRRSVFRGIAAYHMTAGYLAFSVADQGIGMLESLRLCEEWQNLKNDKEALRAVIVDYASRKGDLGQGEGLKNVMKNMASRSAWVRLRSGNSSVRVLEEDGKVAPQWAESAPMSGVQVSVVCAAKARPEEIPISFDSITGLGY